MVPFLVLSRRNLSCPFPHSSSNPRRLNILQPLGARFSTHVPCFQHLAASFSKCAFCIPDGSAGTWGGTPFKPRVSPRPLPFSPSQFSPPIFQFRFSSAAFRVSRFAFRVSRFTVGPLESTLTQTLVSVDSRPLTETLTPLDATLTKKQGGGGDLSFL